MVIRRIGPLSIAKVAGVLYAGLGLLIGVMFALIGLAGVAGGLASDEPGGAALGAIFGVGAIILMPIIYGVVGFMMTLIMAGLFNLIVRFVGGVEVDVDVDVQ